MNEDDLAHGHLATLCKLATGVYAYNLGTGRGNRVLRMVRSFEAASGRPVPYQMAPRRPGDIAACYADLSLAERELGWQATRNVDQMGADSWRWRNTPT